MKRHGMLLVLPCATLLLATACSSKSLQKRDETGSGFRSPGWTLDVYLAEVDNAPDKKAITMDRFIAEMRAMAEKNLKKQPGKERPTIGEHSSARSLGQQMIEKQLAAASKFYQYTDPDKKEALVAINPDGKVIIRWPPVYLLPGKQPQPIMTTAQSSSASSR